MGPSCWLKLASPVLQNWEKLCFALFWNMTQYSVVEPVFFLGKLIATYRSTLHHSPLDNDMNAHSCKDLKLFITDQQLNSILKKQLLPITPTLHHHFFTATITGTTTNSATSMIATSTVTVMATSLLYLCGTAVVILLYFDNRKITYVFMSRCL